MKLGELDGVKIMLSPEAYAEVKKQKIIEENSILKEQQQEIEKLQNIIKKIREYILNLENSEEINIYQEDKSWAYILYLLDNLESKGE